MAGLRIAVEVVSHGRGRSGHPVGHNGHVLQAASPSRKWRSLEHFCCVEQQAIDALWSCDQWIRAMKCLFAPQPSRPDVKVTEFLIESHNFPRAPFFFCSKQFRPDLSLFPHSCLCFIVFIAAGTIGPCSKVYSALLLLLALSVIATATAFLSRPHDGVWPRPTPPLSFPLFRLFTSVFLSATGPASGSFLNSTSSSREREAVHLEVGGFLSLR